MSIQRIGGLDVAYPGDGVNDALALHRSPCTARTSASPSTRPGRPRRRVRWSPG
ncbi:hypothetical protein [Microbispora bryophytorum]|uniref:hypothetical protein n=1 Tax=Microbispora bryophytorum TaxID=1460882 RepID=UPI0033DCBBA3